jgi:hypothetical protein
MELENIRLSKVNQVQKDKDHMWKTDPNTNTSLSYRCIMYICNSNSNCTLYIYIYIYREREKVHVSKVELLEETKGGGKEEKDRK